MFTRIETFLGSFGSALKNRPHNRRGVLRRLRQRRLLFESLEERRVLASVGFGFALAAGSTGSDSGEAIATDSDGNVYVTGNFTGTADFDPGPGVVNLTNNGESAIFVAKYTAAGNLVWARAMGGTGGIGGVWSHGIAVDGAGNVYTTGSLFATVDFDPGPGTFNLHSNSGSDIFVSKLDSAGNFVWARGMGGPNGTGEVRGYGIAVDGAGNVYTTGELWGTVDFNPGVGTFNLTSNGAHDVFVSKLDSEGNFVWARAMGGTDISAGFDIAVDGAGNVYTTGWFWGTVDFDPGPDTFHLTGSGAQSNIFVSKMDSSGNFVWAKAMVSTDDFPSNGHGSGIAVDAAGNVYVTGHFAGPVDFDPGPGVVHLSGTDEIHDGVFASKLDSAGNFVWARALGGTGWDVGRGIAVDGAGNVYTTGRFQGTADFNPGAGTFNLSSSGGSDIFVSKLDNAGNFVWARAMGGTMNDYGSGIAVDGTGNVYTTGGFQGTADFDPGEGTFYLTSNGSTDIFVSKLTQTGDAGETLASAAHLGVLTTESSLTRLGRIGDGPYGARDTDVYQFTLAQSGRLDIRLTTFEGLWSPSDWALAGYVRLFDATGREMLAGQTVVQRNAQGKIVQVAAGLSTNTLAVGSYYLGVSGLPNRNYDPRSLVGRQEGSTGEYRLDLTLQEVASHLWEPQIAVAATYDGNPDPNVLGQFMVGAVVDPVWNAFTAHVTPPAGFTTTAVAFDTNFNGELDAGDYVATDGSNGWTWTTNVSSLPGDVTLLVWAQEASGTWSVPDEFSIETLALPDWMDPELTRIQFNEALERYEVQSLIGKRFGADTPEWFPEWVAYRDGERTWNGMYAGASVEAYVKLSGKVVTQEVVPVLGMSFLGIDLPLKMNLGRQAEMTIDLFRFVDRYRDPRSYLAANRDHRVAGYYDQRKAVPEVTLSYQGQVALDGRLNFTEFQFLFGIKLSASGTAFSFDIPTLHWPLPVFPAVSVAVTPRIGWSPYLDVSMAMNLDAEWQPRFQMFSVDVGAAGSVSLAAEAALLGGAARGGVEVSGGVGVGFNATYDGDWIYSIPVTFDAGFDFVGSLGWGLLSGRFPIWSWSEDLFDLLQPWGTSSGAWASPGAMGLPETDAEDLILSDGSTARSGTGEIGYAWTNIPLDGMPSPLNFQRQSQGVWGDVEQVAGSAHHRGQPALIPLDGERWMVLWSQSNLLADTLGELTGEEVMAAQEIWYAVRDSEGWGPAQPLTENQVCDDSPAIVERPDGSVMAVWRQMSGLDLADLSASDLVYAVWDGVQWSAPGVLADTDAALTHAALAVLADEKVVAVWLSDLTGYGGEATVWTAVHDGTEWSPALRITDEQAGLLAWPRLASLPDGRAIAFWTDEDARGTVLMTTVRDATSGQWGEPEAATSVQRLVGKPEVVLDGSVVRVVYHGYAEGSEILVISRDFASIGSAWSEPEPLSSEGTDAWWVSAAMDDAGVLQARYVVQASLEDSSMIPLPDLAVTADSLSLETFPPASGSENAVEAVVVNRGLIASEATTVSLYHGDPTAGGTHLLSEPLPALAVGEAVTVRLPWVPAVVADYALFVVVDDQAQVAELHEDNNTAQITVGVLAIPTIALAPESDTGLLGDGRTTVRRPMLQGAAGDAVTVAVFVEQLDAPVGYATLGDGMFSVVLPELDFGPTTVWAQALDASGNASPLSSPLELFIEATTLPAVAWLGLIEESDSGEVGDGLTNVSRPEIVGWGHPWTAVSIYEDGQLLGETTADGQGGFRFTPTIDLHDGVRTITTVQRDDLGNVSPESLPWLLTIDTAAPSVEHVLLRGSAWTQDFLDYLDAEGLGHPSIPRLGYRVPDGPAQMDVLPLTGVDTISVFFGENVSVRIQAMTCHGTEHGDYAIATDGFVYDPVSLSATWTLNEPIHRDTVVLKVTDAVTDLAGNALDGDWDDGQSEFPSGDGIPGGDFELSFVVWLNLAPVIENLTATPNPVFRPTTDVLLTAEVNDSDGSVVSVEFYREDQLLGTAAEDDSWTWMVDTATWQYGEHIVFARARDNDGTYSEWVNTTVTILNAPPVLTTIAPLAGAVADEPFTVSYAALMAASDASDADGDAISFRVETVTSGVLTMNGEPVTPGETPLSAEETWVWTPADGTRGVVEAFTVVAWDGELASSPAVAVQMLVDRTLDAVLVDGTLSIVDLHPDGQPNSMTVRLAGLDLVITDANEGFAFAPSGGELGDNDRTLTIPLALVTSLVIDLAGGDDVLTVDFSGGNPIPPGGLYYYGGSGSDDLALSGHAFHTSRFTYVNASDGEIILDPDGTATALSRITYEGLAPITSSIASDVVELIYTGGDETITVSDAGSGQTVAVSTLGEVTTFTNPTRLLRIVATNGTDTIDVGALASGYASIEIEGDDVTDVVHFNGAITFAANHGLTVSNVGTVNLPNTASDIAASGTGAVNITALKTIVLALGSSITAVDGALLLSANQQAAPPAGERAGITLDGAAVSTTGTGGIWLTADSLELTASALVDAGPNEVVVRPRSVGTRIDLGGDDVLAGSPLTLGLSANELDRITAGTLTVGDADSGPLTVTVPIVRSGATDMQLISGEAIIFDPGSIDTAGGILRLSPGTVVRPVTAGTDVTAGNVLFSDGAELEIQIDGTTVDTEYSQLNVAGTIDLTGVSLAVSGNYSPAVGDTFTVVNNSGSQPVIGTFTGLPEGAVMPDFLGSELPATITYLGGDGNDVVIKQTGGTRIEMTIVPTPSATGDGGRVVSLPASVDWVHEWQSFWVEIWVGAPDMPTLAVAGATVDLRYNTEYLTALEFEHGSAFPLDCTGTIDDALGLVGGIRGSTGSTGVVGDGYLLLARVRFASSGGDQVPVDDVGRNIGPYDMQIVLADAQSLLVGAGPVVPESGGAPATELWAVMYDMDDNNRIDFGDLSYFAPAFGRDVGPPESQPPYVWWADFDRSGRVDFGDLSFFAPNFNKTRAAVQAGNQTLIFPPNFPETWRTGEGGGSGETGEGEWQTLGGDAEQEPKVENMPLVGFSEMAAGSLGEAPATTFRNLNLSLGSWRDSGTTQQISGDAQRLVPIRSRESARVDRIERRQLVAEYEDLLEDVLSLLAEDMASGPAGGALHPHDALFALAGR